MRPNSELNSEITLKDLFVIVIIVCDLIFLTLKLDEANNSDYATTRKIQLAK